MGNGSPSTVWGGWNNVNLQNIIKETPNPLHFQIIPDAPQAVIFKYSNSCSEMRNFEELVVPR